MIAPCGMYTAPNRVRGAAAVLTVAVIAGTIASSNGSATVAPTPRRNVRRGNDSLEMNIAGHSPHIDVDDGCSARLQPRPCRADARRYCLETGSSAAVFDDGAASFSPGPLIRF